MTLTDSELDARVATGAALFDARYPGWASGVNRVMLDISDTKFCVAAQVVCSSADDDSYIDATGELGLLSAAEDVALGFALSIMEVAERRRELGSDDRTAIYAPLTDAWLRAIDARLAAS